MSQLTPEMIKKTAQLAQLEISDAELATLSHDLEGIFELFTTLDKAEVSALAPLGHPLGDVQPLREDRAIKRQLLDNIEQNAPLAENDFITVPKVIE